MIGSLSLKRLEAPLHLWALCGFAVTQPLLDLLRQNREFLIAHEAGPTDVLLLVATILFVPTSAALVLGATLGLLSRSLRRGFYLSCICLLVALIALPVLDRASGSELGWSAVIASVAIGVGAAALYASWEPARGFLTVLAAAPLVFLWTFATDPEIEDHVWPAAPPEVASWPPSGALRPAVVVLLDELSVSTLMGPDRRIDAGLFPNFARLASDSIWFRNATTTALETRMALWSIVTGRRFPGRKAREHNLFSLLRSSHRLNAFELVTDLCRGCPLQQAAPFLERTKLLLLDVAAIYAHVVVPGALAGSLPPVDLGWVDFWGVRPQMTTVRVDPRIQKQVGELARIDRTHVFQRFLETLDGSDPPSLDFLHIMLPHLPWIYLETGTSYPSYWTPAGLSPARIWGEEEWPTVLAWQRYVLQVGFVDKLIGALLDHLVERGLYHEALLVVTADHGAAFTPGRPRRQATRESLSELMRIPLFVKLPGERAGRIDDRNVESIDILPTIADALGIEVPWETDGRSALDQSVPPRSTKKTSWPIGAPSWKVDAELPKRWPGLQRKLDLLGPSPRWSDVHAISARPGVLGRRTSETQARTSHGLRGRIDQHHALRSIHLGTGSLPVYLTGAIELRDGSPPEAVAIAVNGVIRATSAIFAHGDEELAFAALLPENSLREGDNELDLFSIVDGGTLEHIPLDGE